MKYITITSKHHDGFCLSKTKETTFNSMHSPAKRDLIGELGQACEREKLRLFLFYSYAADWKLIHYFENNDLELYNIKDDIGKKNNLAESHPEKRSELLEMLENWRKETGAPVPKELNPEYIPPELPGKEN